MKTIPITDQASAQSAQPKRTRTPLWRRIIRRLGRLLYRPIAAKGREVEETYLQR